MMFENGDQFEDAVLPEWNPEYFQRGSHWRRIAGAAFFLANSIGDVNRLAEVRYNTEIIKMIDTLVPVEGYDKFLPPVTPLKSVVLEEEGPDWLDAAEEKAQLRFAMQKEQAQFIFRLSDRQLERAIEKVGERKRRYNATLYEGEE